MGDVKLLEWTGSGVFKKGKKDVYKKDDYVDPEGIDPDTLAKLKKAGLLVDPDKAIAKKKAAATKAKLTGKK